MASSTTKPVAMVSAMRDRLSRLNPSRYMTPKVPTRDSGTDTLGMSGRGEVAQEQENHHHDQRDGQQQSELDVPHRSANRRGAIGEHGNLHSLGQSALQLRQQFLDAVHHLDDVGAGLPLNIDDDRRHVVHPCRLLHVLGIVDDVGDVGQMHRRAIPVCHDERPVLRTGEKLIVGGNGERTLRPVEGSLGLIDVGRHDGAAQIFQAQSVGGQRGRVRLHPHGRALSSADAHQPHARQLGNFLRQTGCRRGPRREAAEASWKSAQG